MENLIAQYAPTLLPQLGLAVIFMAVAWILYKDGDSKLKSKDDRIKELTGLLVQLYEQNATLHSKNMEVITKLDEAMRSQSMSLNRNTDALISLEKKIIESSK